MDCLVIVDMQVDFMNSETEHLQDKILSFLSSKSGCFNYIVTTRYINQENTACYKFEGWRDCLRGTLGVELVDGLRSRYKTFDKDKYSCYTDEFKEFIKANNITRIFFAGVNTGCCILHSAFDTYNDLIETYVIEDLCGSTLGKYSHNCAVQILEESITEEGVIKSSKF